MLAALASTTNWQPLEGADGLNDSGRECNSGGGDGLPPLVNSNVSNLVFFKSNFHPRENYQQVVETSISATQSN